MARYSRSKITSHPIGLGPYSGPGFGKAVGKSRYGRKRRRGKGGSRRSCKRTLAVCDVFKGGRLANCRRIARRKK